MYKKIICYEEEKIYNMITTSTAILLRQDVSEVLFFFCL